MDDKRPIFRAEKDDHKNKKHPDLERHHHMVLRNILPLGGYLLLEKGHKQDSLQ
jgi:hypothetical protein